MNDIEMALTAEYTLLMSSREVVSECGSKGTETGPLNVPESVRSTAWTAT